MTVRAGTKRGTRDTMGGSGRATIGVVMAATACSVTPEMSIHPISIISHMLLMP